MLSNRLILLSPNTALHISKDKSQPCIHAMTVNKKSPYCLVINFKEVQEFLQMFLSSMSLKDYGNMETHFIAQSQPSIFQEFKTSEVRWFPANICLSKRDLTHHISHGELCLRPPEVLSCILKVKALVLFDKVK